MRIMPGFILLLAIGAAFGIARSQTGLAESSTPKQPRLIMPLDCAIGRDCMIQKLFDHNPGPDRADYMCGTLTTDGHDGTDFRITDLDRYRRGVPVVAVAAGVVLRTRDGEPDESIKERGTTGGRDAGNGVVIDHGDGWVTQYSHMRRGSLRVHSGDQVPAGQPLGLVGLSGNTEYSHLHFSIRYRDQPVDPFAPQSAAADCRSGPRANTLWANPVASGLTYRSTALAGVGIASSIGDIGKADLPTWNGADDHKSAPLLLWVQIAGVLAGDVIHFHITRSDGSTVVDQHSPVAKSALIWTGYAGRKAPQAGWPAGRYGGSIWLERRAARTLSADVSVDLP